MINNIESCVKPAFGYMLARVEGEFIYSECSDCPETDFHVMLRDYGIHVMKAVKIPEEDRKPEVLRRVVVP